MNKILIIDDQESITQGLQVLLTNKGYNTCVANSAEDALKLIKNNLYDLIITDYKMPGMLGIELIQKLVNENYPSLFIIISAYLTAEDVVLALRNKVVDVFQKPFNNNQLINRIEQLLSSNKSPILNNNNFQFNFTKFVGSNFIVSNYYQSNNYFKFLIYTIEDQTFILLLPNSCNESFVYIFDGLFEFINTSDYNVILQKIISISEKHNLNKYVFINIKNSILNYYNKNLYCELIDVDENITLLNNSNNSITITDDWMLYISNNNNQIINKPDNCLNIRPNMFKNDNEPYLLINDFNQNKKLFNFESIYPFKNIDKIINQFNFIFNSYLENEKYIKLLSMFSEIMLNLQNIQFNNTIKIQLDISLNNELKLNIHSDNIKFNALNSVKNAEKQYIDYLYETINFTDDNNINLEMKF